MSRSRYSILLCLLPLLLTSCTSEQPFIDPITGDPQPDWWSSVDAPLLRSDQERQALWQGKDRCCIDKDDLTDNRREYFKSCSIAIKQYPYDEHLLVNCLWTMEGDARSLDRTKRFQHVIDNYFYHDRKLDNCANCMHADTVAQISLSQARIKYRADDLSESIYLIENMLDSRERDISPWLRLDMLTQLIRFYVMDDLSLDRKRRIEAAWSEFYPLRNTDTIARRFGAFEKVYRQFIPE
ncbi:MAG: hypothetical protein ACWA5Q_01355 [bacterium]